MIKSTWKRFLGVENPYFQCIKNDKWQPFSFECIYFYSIFCWNNYLDRFLFTLWNIYLPLTLTPDELGLYFFFCAYSWSTMFIIVLFFNAVFMLAKIEFLFTELTNGESLKEILRTVDLSPPPPKKDPQKKQKKAFCLFQDENM